GLEIRQKGKMQLAIPAKRSMTPHPVNRYAHHHRAKLLELGKQFVVKSDLITAYRAPIGRIKNEHNWLAAKLTQSDGLIGGALEPEIRGGRTGRQSCGFVMNRLKTYRIGSVRSIHTIGAWNHLLAWV